MRILANILSVVTLLGGLLSVSGMAQDVNPARIVSVSAVAGGGEAVVTVRARIAEGWHINAHKPSEEYLIPTEVTWDLPSGFSVLAVDYPPAVRKTFSFSETPLDVYEGEFAITARMQVTAEGKHEIPMTLTYQACDHEKCLPPSSVKTSVTLTGLAGQPATAQAQETGAAWLASVRFMRNPIEELFEKHGVLAWTVIFGFGLALNLTPCVYPMIPITVAFFGGRAGGAKAVGPAFAYFLGIVVSYSALGTIAGLTGGLLGEALQSPFVLIALTLLMVYLAAGSFGWAPVGLPAGFVQRFGAGRMPFGSFGMGLTMGVVAAPCIGPFIAGLLAYVGLKQSPVLGMALFAVLSAGLGLPYLFLGIFSGQIHRLPRSGDWLDYVKWVFGFILLGMAVYFSSSLIPDALESKLYASILAGAGIAAAVAGFRRSRVAFGIGAGLAIVLIGSAWKVAAPSTEESFWLPYDEVSYEAALAAGRPVILDFFAEWCVPCKVLDRTTFSDPQVRQALDNVVRLKVDLTSYESPSSRKVRQKFGIVGVPTVIYVDGTGAERMRWLGEFTAEEFLNEPRVKR